MCSSRVMTPKGSKRICSQAGMIYVFVPPSCRYGDKCQVSSSSLDFNSSFKLSGAPDPIFVPLECGLLGSVRTDSCWLAASNHSSQQACQNWYRGENAITASQRIPMVGASLLSRARSSRHCIRRRTATLLQIVVLISTGVLVSVSNASRC
jgi:hypothetical protein